MPLENDDGPNIAARCGPGADVLDLTAIPVIRRRNEFLRLSRLGDRRVATCRAAQGINGHGAGWGDVDGDGSLDLLVGEDPIRGYNGSPTASARLFRNRGQLHFDDVSQAAGLPKGTPGLGVAAGDVNNDGWPDLFPAATGKSEIVAAAPVPFHSIPCGVLDPDRLTFYGGTAAAIDHEDEGIRFLAYDVRNRKLLYSGPDGPASYMMLGRSTGRYLYYVPGAHGGSPQDGSAIVQFDIKTGKKKVIAFLEPCYTDNHGFTLKGTYATALDTTGECLYITCLYITWNVSRGTRAWGSCGLTVVVIPATERMS